MKAIFLFLTFYFLFCVAHGQNQRNLWPSGNYSRNPCPDFNLNNRADWQALGVAISFPDNNGCFQPELVNLARQDILAIRRVLGLPAVESDQVYSYSAVNVAHKFSIYFSPATSQELASAIEKSELALKYEAGIWDNLPGTIFSLDLSRFQFPHSLTSLGHYLRTLPVRSMSANIAVQGDLTGRLSSLEIKLNTIRDRLQLHSEILQLNDGEKWLIPGTDLNPLGKVKRAKLQFNSNVGFHILAGNAGQDVNLNIGGHRLLRSLEDLAGYVFARGTLEFGEYLKGLPLSSLSSTTGPISHEDGSQGETLLQVDLEFAEGVDPFMLMRQMRSFWSPELRRAVVKNVSFPEPNPLQPAIFFIGSSLRDAKRDYFYNGPRGGFKVRVSGGQAQVIESDAGESFSPLDQFTRSLRGY